MVSQEANIHRTPWLVTRRRTCPICKGDVVRSLSQSYHNRLQPPSSASSPQEFEDRDDLQALVAGTRNDSPSASQPVPISTSAPADYSPFGDDIETGRTVDSVEQHSDTSPDSSNHELGGSLRELSSTVSTVIWRGFDVIRNTNVLQRRLPQDDTDRDR